MTYRIHTSKSIRHPSVVSSLKKLDVVSRSQLIKQLWAYSGTSVYVRFGISPTWYTSCSDAKNFACYTTFVWNMTRVLELVWVKMSHDRQKQSSLDRFLVKVKPGEPQPGATREKGKRKNTRMSDSWSFIGSGLPFQTITSPQHHISKHSTLSAR
jgi:hypothetical protein